MILEKKDRYIYIYKGPKKEDCWSGPFTVEEQHSLKKENDLIKQEKKTLISWGENVLVVCLCFDASVKTH